MFLMVFSFFTLFLVSCKKPEYLVKKSKPLYTLYYFYHTDYICVYCMQKMNQGSRHCHICKKCVEVNKYLVV